MDKIYINDLPLSTVIGTLPEERLKTQKIILDLEIALDLSRAAATDDLEYTIDYSEIENRMVKLAEDSKFYLIEAFAGAAADIVLSYPQTVSCKTTVTKPNASRRATVRVSVEKTKK